MCWLSSNRMLADVTPRLTLDNSAYQGRSYPEFSSQGRTREPSVAGMVLTDKTNIFIRKLGRSSRHPLEVDPASINGVVNVVLDGSHCQMAKPEALPVIAVMPDHYAIGQRERDPMTHRIGQNVDTQRFSLEVDLTIPASTPSNTAKWPIHAGIGPIVALDRIKEILKSVHFFILSCMSHTRNIHTVIEGDTT